MNALMSIQVRVLSAQASRDIRRLEAELALLRKQQSAASAAASGFPGQGSVQAFTKWGNQVQWAGRQLQYNFTLPILLAGGAAAKFALDNERAMTRVVKVYGDGTMSAQQLKNETDALGRSFEALSNKFGVAQADAINIAADWAAAGASGVALAKSVELTMETMILGEMEAAEATQALIAIQAQYGQDVKTLSKTIDTLNMIENQTGISMQGLVQGFARAAGVARTAGVDVRHLGAMLAALVPASGSAANAGNALKTMLSRLMSPTKEANQVFQEMGINTESLAWQSLTATQRLEKMATTFDKLDDAQKIVVSTVAASRWQINRFDVLMRDIINTNGYYQKALNSTSDATANYNQRVRELNAVLNSNPQRLKQIWTILQNAMADVIQPMIPVILLLSAQLVKMLQWFNELDPAVQKLSLVMLLLLAAIGPVARYIGSVSVLLGILHSAFLKTGGSALKLAGILGGALLSPFKLIGRAGSEIAVQFGKLAPTLAKIGPRLGVGLMGGVASGISASAGIVGTSIFAAVTYGIRSIPAVIGGILKLAFGKNLPVITTMVAQFGAAVSAAFAFWTRGAMGIWTRFWALVPIVMSASTGRMAGLWALFAKSFGAIWALTMVTFQKLMAVAVIIFTQGMAAMRAATAATAGALALLPAAAAAGSAVVVSSAARAARGVAMIGGAGAIAIRGITAIGPAIIAVGATAARVVPMIAVAMSRLPLLIAAAFARIVPLITAALATLGPVLVAILTSPWTYAIAAILGIAYNFRDEIANAWNTALDYLSEVTESAFGPVVRFFHEGVAAIERAFWRLPAGVRDAILTVVGIVRAAALQVYEWFSYLNPFAHHSPSLVEQVTAGMAEIKRQYGSVGNVGAIFGKAAKDLAAYKNAVAALGAGPFADQRGDVAKGYPKLLPIFDALIADLTVLNRLAAQQAAAVAAQEAVVKRWEKALDAANDALDAEQAKLDSLSDALDKLNDAYDAHKTALENYASAPIKGMGEMSDAIFENEMAQKKLRLEMLKWEQTNGSIEDVKNNMAGLQGSIEKLRAEAASLRMAGAGSDVLGPINAEIAAMEAAYAAMEDSVRNSPIGKMQDELEKLQTQGEILDLENSIKFDPMIREIDKLAKAQEELAYDEIVAGIKAERDAMALLEPQIAAATAAVQAQQAAVDAATASRDAIQDRYDTEKEKLDTLKDAYSQTEDAIREIESALNDMGRTAGEQIRKLEDAARKAKEASEYASPGLENFRNAAGGNFPDPGEMHKIGREGIAGDQSALIDEFTKSISDDVKAQFGKFDLMEPIRKKWDEMWKWMETNVAPKVQAVWTSIKEIWNSASDGVVDSGFADKVLGVWDGIANGARTVWGFIGGLVNLFKDDFVHIIDVIVEAGKKIWNEIGPELAKFKDLWPGLSEILKVVGKVIGYLAAGAFGLLIGALKIVTSILAHTLGPALDIIIGVVKGLIQIFRGFAEVIVGIFTGDLDMVINGVKDTFNGIIDAVVAIVKGGWNLIWGAVEGLINGIIDWFKWLADELVGHSIIPDMINDIVDWFKGMPKKIWDAIIRLVNDVTTIARDMWDAFSKKSSEKWGEFVGWAKGLGQSAYNNIIGIKDKLWEVARATWQGFRDKSGSMWDSFITYLKGRPQAAYDNFISIKDKLWEVARAAFQALRDKAGSMVDGKGGFMDWIRSIPGKVASALGGIGSAVANAVKGSWNGAAKWLNDNAVGALNKVTGKFGFTMPNLPTFQRGGVIPGRVSKRDNTIIGARTGEGVIVPELVRALGGERGLWELNRAAERGHGGALASLGIERFASGGVVGNVTGWLQKGAGWALEKIFNAGASGVRKLIPGRPFFEDYSAGNLANAAKKARTWGDNQESLGNGVLPGTGYQWQTKMLKAAFPGATVTSGFRPGAITATGDVSMHAMGRAIDIVPTSQAIYDWIYRTYGKNTRQLIWSPMGVKGKNIHNGRDYRPSATTLADHWDHIHWGYDRGGILKPGMTLAYNGTGKDEITLTNDDWKTFSNVVSLMDRMSQKSASGVTPGSAMVARTGTTMAALEARLRAAETRDTTTTRSARGGDTFNINGDLSFPNMTDGGGIEDFIETLRGLAG